MLTADVQASKLLRLGKVKVRVDELLADLAQACKVSAESVINGIKDEIEHCRTADKRDSSNILRGYELLGRHLKLFTDRVEIKGDYNSMSSDEVARELAQAQLENESVKSEVH